MHLTKTAPSYTFLHDHPSSATSFLSPEAGFLPPTPLPPLPPSHSIWSTLAESLPTLIRNDAWLPFLSSFPALSASPQALPEAHLLRANFCLGAAAHAITNIANLPVPDNVLTPWRQIAVRLDRPTASLNSLDWFLYNYEYVHHRFGNLHLTTDKAQSKPRTFISDPWLQTAPRQTITGTVTETHFITGCFAIEHAARALPTYVTRAQQACLSRDNSSLRQTLIAIIHVLEHMTLAFQSADVRPLSRTYIDQVEWGRVIGVIGIPVEPGEKTISGLLFPSIHLLDVFFSRTKYASEMGVLECTDRRWLPQMHRDFFDAVSKVSVFDYISSLAQSEPDRHQLVNIFRHALSSFAADSGLLGKHRLRITGILELSMKIGRPSTAAGTQSTKWQKRAWRRINEAMLAGMEERLEKCHDQYCDASVADCVQLRKGSDAAHLLTLKTNGAMVYQPGDHIAVLPENSDKVIEQTLEALQVKGETLVQVRNRTWLQALSDRALNYDQLCDNSDDTPKVQMSAQDFLRIASLQPLDRRTSSSLLASMFVTNPALVSFLTSGRAGSVSIAMNVLRHCGDISAKHLLPDLDEILRPLAPRYYSVASHMSTDPNIVQVVVGKVRYNSSPSISFEHDQPPWKRQLEKVTLPVADSKEYMHKFLSVSSEEVSCSHHQEGIIGCANNESSMKLSKTKALGEIVGFLRRNPGGFAKRISAKGTFRAQVICHDARVNQKSLPSMEGVSSSYLIRLQEGARVRARVIPELDFHFPVDPYAPLIMISLGSGAAPFRSFLKELVRRKPKDGSPCRPAWLILGVKTREDIPFREDLEEAVCKEKVADLSIAFSREDVELDICHTSEKLTFRSGVRKRIPGLFEDEHIAIKFWNAISSHGHVYVCGIPELERIARDLISFVVTRYASSLWSLTYFDTNSNLKGLAEEFADRMAAERRLHVDCYYSGKRPPAKQFFTPADVAEHRSTGTCWVIFRGAVYDLSRYLAIHPGGPKLLLDKQGRDMTLDFNIAHGAENLRIASMVEPYRIGSVEVFRKASERIRTFMNCWSVPLLHGMLEHRFVFVLDENNFPELGEPKSFLQFKSQASSAGGVGDLCRKFWLTYEPDCFQYIDSFLQDDKLGKGIHSLCNNLGGKINMERLRNDVCAERHRALSAVRTGVGMLSGSEAVAFLSEAQLFMEKLTDVCIGVQRVVEDAMRESQAGQDFDDICIVLLASVFRKIREGIKHVYRFLPGR